MKAVEEDRAPPVFQSPGVRPRRRRQDRQRIATADQKITAAVAAAAREVVAGEPTATAPTVS